ncbi:MAG: alpha/beta fold hydrolase [Stappiaceae bacterium]
MLFEFDAFSVDTERLELSKDGRPVKIEPLVFSVLAHLIENRHLVVSKDGLIKALWDGRFVSDAAVSSTVKAARQAIGDDGKTQKYIRTLHGRGFRFVGEVTGKGEYTPASGAPQAAANENDADADPGIDQDIRFCSTSDGVSLATSITGIGLPVVKVATWMSHIEYDWESPIWSHILRTLSRETMLIRYDERGNGLSDWDVDEISFDKFVSDLETVIDASGVEQVVLFGLSQGVAIACEYAARHPDRVLGLVLYGGYCRGWKNRNDPKTEAQTYALLELARHGWGADNPAFRQVFTSLFVPDATREQADWFNELQKISTTSENAVRIDNALGEVNICDRLSKVTAPALVMHCRDDAVIPYEEGRRVAKLLPNSKFVSLDGRNHIPLETEPAWFRFIAEFHMFLNSVKQCG